MRPARALVQRHERPRFIAHRGASTVAPENTLASFRAALELGAIAIETDVHLTRDRRVVSLHDATLDRTTTGTGPVAEHTLAELADLDAGSWFDASFSHERVPELGAVLDLLRGRALLMIELKAGPGIEEAIRDLLDARSQRDQVAFFSFYPDKIARCRALMPDVPTVWLAWRDDGVYDERTEAYARAVHADAIGFDHRHLHAEHVQRAHAAGLPVFTWTVNAPEDVARTAALGVDVIISDQVLR